MVVDVVAVDCEGLHGYTVRYLSAIVASDLVLEGPH